jgi:hypothetical protein
MANLATWRCQPGDFSLPDGATPWQAPIVPVMPSYCEIGGGSSTANLGVTLF